MSNDRYFYGDAEQNEHGPYSAAQMRALAMNGTLTLATPVYQSGTSAWKTLAAFPALLASKPSLIRRTLPIFLGVVAAGALLIGSVAARSRYNSWKLALNQASALVAIQMEYKMRTIGRFEGVRHAEIIERIERDLHEADEKIVEALDTTLRVIDAKPFFIPLTAEEKKIRGQFASGLEAARRIAAKKPSKD
jgi:hypothetical protein